MTFWPQSAMSSIFITLVLFLFFDHSPFLNESANSFRGLGISAKSVTIDGGVLFTI